MDGVRICSGVSSPDVASHSDLAVGKRTGLLKVYNGASVASIDTVLFGRTLAVVAAACEEAGGSPNDGGW